MYVQEKTDGVYRWHYEYLRIYSKELDGDRRCRDPVQTRVQFIAPKKSISIEKTSFFSFLDSEIEHFALHEPGLCTRRQDILRSTNLCATCSAGTAANLASPTTIPYNEVDRHGFSDSFSNFRGLSCH